MARPALARLALLLPLALAAQQPDPSFRQAGVCSRCHVAQVLEWSAGGHTRAGTSCQGCHGASEAHVADERNQVKPERLPRGEREFTALCANCHAAGCPKTARKDGCPSCHHAHALSNPEDKQLRQTAAAEDPRRARFLRLMEQGEQHTARGEWKQAREAFAAAAAVSPADRRAAARRRMAERRLDPRQPGIEIVGGAFDAESGLPLRVREAGLGIEMVLVAAGGADIGLGSFPHSSPVHTVHTGAFYLAIHEVTSQQWTALGVEDPSVHRGAGLPVHNVSWRDAQQWIGRLNARVPGGGFRLPTEAEWERAAQRHGVIEDEAWRRGNAAIGDAAGGGFRESEAYAPRPVGTKKPNALGLFDMLGNVAEWCSSLYRPYPYQARDGRESPDDAGLRVLRGGHFADSIDALQPALRHSERPERRNPWNGLRLARSPLPATPATAAASGYRDAPPADTTPRR
jgi:formylglycine-generating enzyme required for sulfatase activity